MAAVVHGPQLGKLTFRLPLSSGNAVEHIGRVSYFW